MSSINSVRNLQIFYFSKKNKKIKNLYNAHARKRSAPGSAAIHTTQVFLQFAETQVQKIKK